LTEKERFATILRRDSLRMTTRVEHPEMGANITNKSRSVPLRRNRRLLKKRVPRQRKSERHKAAKSVAAAGQGATALNRVWTEKRSEYLANLDAAAKLAQEANRRGEHFLTIDIAEAVSEAAQGHIPVRLLQAQALALARTGSTERASKILAELGGDRASDAETLGLIAGIYKQLGTAATDPAKKKEWLSQAQRLYQLGLERAGDAYCGINAATLAVLLDDFRAAARLARLTLRQKPQNDEYYDLATRAEAVLIQKHDREAATLYKRACTVARDRWADVASTRKQCRLLALKLYGIESKFDKCFPRGAIAIFAGHIADVPGRPTPRFPAKAERAVRARIDRWLREKAIRTTFSSAAAGSDIIFLTAAQRAEIETRIILPFAASEFIETSVRPGGDRWVERFNALLSKADAPTIINDQVADDRSAAYDFTNRMIAAKAMLRARDLQLPVYALAIWDRDRGDGVGGTADAVVSWCRAKIETYAIHPTDPRRDGPVCDGGGVTAAPFERTQTALPQGYRTEVCAALHLYFESYFSLREQEHPQFQEQILTPISRLMATSQHSPESSYGFGADYAFVFRSMRAAGMFAGELLRKLAENAKNSRGPVHLPRISLHAGPVFLMVNPVLNQYSHEGSALTRAARMARPLEPGIPFCTEPFAALSALETIREFRFEDAGTQRYVDGTSDRLFVVRFHDY
jgi:hypothetical protein